MLRVCSAVNIAKAGDSDEAQAIKDSWINHIES